MVPQPPEALGTVIVWSGPLPELQTFYLPKSFRGSWTELGRLSASETPIAKQQHLD
jgi:hypothetical protein